jgi:hypothetical protein
MAASGVAGGREEEGGRKKRKWDQSWRDHNLNDEFSHVYARLAHLFPLAPHWRNSSTLADESECGCGAVDTSVRW